MAEPAREIERDQNLLTGSSRPGLRAGARQPARHDSRHRAGECARQSCRPAAKSCGGFPAFLSTQSQAVPAGSGCPTSGNPHIPALGPRSRHPHRLAGLPRLARTASFRRGDPRHHQMVARGSRVVRDRLLLLFVRGVHMIEDGIPLRHVEQLAPGSHVPHQHQLHAGRRIFRPDGMVSMRPLNDRSTPSARSRSPPGFRRCSRCACPRPACRSSSASRDLARPGLRRSGRSQNRRASGRSWALWSHAPVGHRAHQAARSRSTHAPGAMLITDLKNRQFAVI